LPTQQNMATDGAATAIHFPFRLLTVALVLTTVTFAWSGWIIFDARRDVKTFQDDSLRIEELRGVIVHLEEVLTMSARMATATGDSKWEERYRRFEPQLDAAIKETIKIGASSSNIKAATKTDVANIKLVEMENRAFALVRAGRKEEAQAVLFSPEYETQKQIYAEGITSFASQIRREFDESVRDDQRIDLLSIIAALVVCGISFVTWLSAARGVQRWRTTLEQAVSERKQAEQALRRANDELEVRIEQRTAELGKTNQALQAEITERKRAEEVLKTSEERFRITAESLMDVVYDWDIKEKVDWYGDIDGIMGYPLGGFPRTIEGWAATIHPEDKDRVMAALEGQLKGVAPYVVEYRIGKRDGEWRWWSARGTTLRDDRGEPYKMIGSITDITERKRAEEALRESEQRFRALFEGASEGVFQSTPGGQYRLANPALAKMLGYASSQELIAGVTDIGRQLNVDLGVRAEFQRRIAEQGEVQNFEFQACRKDGATIWLSENAHAVRDASGAVLYYEGILQNITERKRAEEAMRESEERFSGAFEHAPIGVALVSPDGRYLKVNRVLCDLVGYSEAELLTRTFQDITHPEDLEVDLENVRRVIAAEIRSYQMEKRYIHARGHLVTVLLNVSLVRDGQGQPRYFISQVQDITERKRLEGQVFQSQKLETVGKLAGGIAHEFNSILTAIIGQSELLLNNLPPGNPLCKNATEISQAAERAATLTRQLLAYGRKQILQPEILDLNSVLAGMESTLRHLVGRGADVRIAPAAGLKAVKADAGQIEQVIMNMAMNAADAMSNGGKLMLETANVTLDQADVSHFPELKAGEYVRLAITDTGAGMSEEVKARVFEPFFTTKGVGRGTGLGLSTCYGIIKQSGGHISVHSEPARGATFKIYLPQVEPQAKIPIQRLDSPDLPSGTETILLVEDDPVLREMAATLLRRLGYTVLAAANGIEALSLKQQRDNGHIDLLFTDAVMPHMSGKELAERVGALSPHTRILFTSAYIGNAIVHQGVLNQGVALLQKPFTPSALAHKLREVLDQPNAPKPDTAQKTSGFTKITDEAKTP
jgi:two-component system cell cycle sensor histidine kinase/response regulator CckA